jgi:hypothetical protein
MVRLVVVALTCHFQMVLPLLVVVTLVEMEIVMLAVAVEGVLAGLALQRHLLMVVLADQAQYLQSLAHRSPMLVEVEVLGSQLVELLVAEERVLALLVELLLETVEPQILVRVVEEHVTLLIPTLRLLALVVLVLSLFVTRLVKD